MWMSACSDQLVGACFKSADLDMGMDRDGLGGLLVSLSDTGGLRGGNLR